MVFYGCLNSFLANRDLPETTANLDPKETEDYQALLELMDLVGFLDQLSQVYLEETVNLDSLDLWGHQA